MSSSSSYGSYELKEEDQKKIINAHQAASKIDEVNIKLGIIDGHFDPYSDTKNVLSKSTKDAYVGQNRFKVADRAHLLGHDHANHVASSVHNIIPKAELRVIDLNSEPSLLRRTGNARLIAALDEAIRSEVSFINISLRISPDGDWNGKITEEVKAAFLRVRDAGIGIIKSAGNDQEFTGSTDYTCSLVELLQEMNGSMILAAATQYDIDGQFEKLASFSKGKMDFHTGKMKVDQHGRPKLPRGSNLAGLAHEYTVTAPGKYNYAHGAMNNRIKKSGTSMAAPVVTGAAGLIRSAYPELSSTEVLGHILQSARTRSLQDNIDLPAGKYGRGILDVKQTLQRIKEGK